VLSVVRIVSALLATFCVLMGAAATATAQLSPDPKTICTTQSGQSTIVISRLITFAIDKQNIARLDLSSDGDNSINMETNAILDPNLFCRTAGHCNNNSEGKLDTAKSQLLAFLLNISEKDNKGKKFSISRRLGQKSSDDGDLVSDFIAGKYASTCDMGQSTTVTTAGGAPTGTGTTHVTNGPAAGAPEAPAPHNAGSATTSAPNLTPPQTAEAADTAPAADGGSGLKSILSAVVIRAKPADLPYAESSVQFQGLSSASLGFDANDVAHNNTYTASGVTGYQFPLITYGNVGGTTTQIVPYVGENLKKVQTEPHPKTGNFDTLSAGLLVDHIFALGIANEIKFNPQVSRSYQDGSEVASGSLTYIPTPDMDFLAAPYTVGGLVRVMAQPSLNLDYERVFTPGENTVLRALGNYSLFGPGLDLYLWGAPNTYLEQFSANGTYRFYRNLGSGFNTVSVWQSSLSYYPLNNKNVSVTFKYNVGKDITTFTSSKEYMLGIGIKY
jgi:hypothetical protein